MRDRVIRREVFLTKFEDSLPATPTRSDQYGWKAHQVTAKQAARLVNRATNNTRKLYLDKQCPGKRQTHPEHT